MKIIIFAFGLALGYFVGYAEYSGQVEKLLSDKQYLISEYNRLVEEVNGLRGR